jgi:DNA helicase HerA-like ATPase
MARSAAVPNRREVFSDEAFRNHIGIVGKTGSGKTTTAKGFAEQLLAAGRRICVIDPTGVW